RPARAFARALVRGPLFDAGARLRAAPDAFTFASQSIPCARDHSRHSGTGCFTVQRKWYTPLSPTNLNRFFRSVARGSYSENDLRCFLKPPARSRASSSPALWTTAAIF